jgi:replicative DNA helicase
MMQTISFSKLAQKYWDLEKDRHGNPDEHQGWRTHIPELNDILGGIHKHWYIVIGGPQKGGKTAMAVSLLTFFGKSNLKVLPISLEMSDMQYATRLFANVGGIDTDKFRDIQLTDEDWKDAKFAKDTISQFEGAFNYGARDIETVHGLVDEIKPDILFVDYVQLMSSRKVHGKRHEVLAHISAELKGMTLDYPMAVIALVQVGQEAAKSNNFNTAYGFHGSSAFKNDADVAMVIAPVFNPAGEITPEKKRVHIVASRHSREDSFDVTFVGARSLIGGAPKIEKVNMGDVVEATYGPSSYQRKKREEQ